MKKYLIGSNWNGWDNKENQKGKEVSLDEEAVKHLTESNVKLIPVNDKPAKDSK